MYHHDELYGIAQATRDDEFEKEVSDNSDEVTNDNLDTEKSELGCECDE